MAKTDPVSLEYQQSFATLSRRFALDAGEQTAALGGYTPDDIKTYGHMRVRNTIDALCELHGTLSGIFCAVTLPDKIRDSHLPDIHGRIIDGICSGDVLCIRSLRSDVIALNGVC